MGKPKEASYQDIQLAFHPELQNPTWRICSLEVLDPAGTKVAPFCLPRDQPYYSASSGQGFNDKGELTVSCAKHSFAARAILELLPGQTFPSGLTSNLFGFATFPNNTSWNSSNSLYLYPERLQQETNAFSVQGTIVHCLGGWQPLPSGKTFCYVEKSRERSSREETCKLGGGYILELLTREDMQTFVYLMHTIAKISTASIAIGAEAEVVGSTLTWVWQQSGREVSICQAGCLLQTSADVSTSPALNSSLYLDLIMAPNPDDVFMADPPYFALQARAASSSEAAYFVCMKEGENSGATAPTLTINTDKETLAPFEVAKINFRLKTAHQTQFPFKLELQPSSHIRICKLAVTHIGANLPCLQNPGGQPQNGQNTSRMFYTSHKKEAGFSASIEFDMISNWGETELLCSLIFSFTKK